MFGLLCFGNNRVNYPSPKGNGFYAYFYKDGEDAEYLGFRLGDIRNKLENYYE